LRASSDRPAERCGTIVYPPRSARCRRGSRCTLVRLARVSRIGEHLGASRYRAPKSSKDGAHLGRSFKFNARRHVERNRELSRARQRLPPSFLTDGTREISRCNTPLSSKPINLRLCCDDLGPHVALSFSLRARRALDPSHFRARSSSRRRRLVR